MLKIDMRSDTVTTPTPQMREAMFQAQIGDDVFGEDPSINRLQEKAAEMLGKEAALFAASGTMANQICLRLLTTPGDEIICERYAHVYRNEGGAGSILSGLSYWPIDTKRGLLTAEQVAAGINPDNIHYPISKVIALENTHNRGNGSVYSLDEIKKIARLAKENGLFMHLDGARMFHACVKGGYTPKELAACFDTISFCLSKGLGAPVGSMIVSTRENVKKAVRIRKRLGGGMRQAGFLAAAGIYALENNIERLADDHRRAAELARGLAGMKGVSLNPEDVETNIVIFGVGPSGLGPLEVVERLAEKGVGVYPFGGNNLRAVVHLHISDQDIREALDSCAQVLD